MTIALAETEAFEVSAARPASAARTKYRADVDGLRAIAVLSVLFYHGGIAAISGGYVGVDVFFVISGFVITTKLVEEIDQGAFSIASFYVRRIRRILPALVTVILGCAVAATIFFLPDALSDFSRSVVATATFVSNMYFWKNSGYFSIAAFDRPLLHTWSLAIEEQFYIVIPIALFLAVKYARHWAFALFAAVAALSLALSIFMVDRAPTADFFVLPTRAWELLLGVLVALAPWAPPSHRLMREAIVVSAFALIVFAVVTYTPTTPFPGMAALAPTVGTAALIYLGKKGPPTSVASALSVKPLVGIGLISYSLYLFHWPIIVFARYALLRELQGWEIAAALGLSFLLSILSYHYIETPFRRPKRPVTRNHLFFGTAAVLAGLVVLGTGGISTGGLSFLHPAYAKTAIGGQGMDLWRDRRCFLELDQPASAWAGDLCVRTAGARHNAVLWGDSFAAQYVDGLLANRKNLTRNIVQYTSAGCPPVLSYRSYAQPACHDFNARIFDIVARYHADTVVISARWDDLADRGLAGLSDTIARLRAKGLKVYVIGQSPEFLLDVHVLDYRGAGAAGGDAHWYPAFSQDPNRALRAAAMGATFVDPLPAFCHDTACTYKAGGRLLFVDYGHFSQAGSDRAVRSYFPLYRGASDIGAPKTGGDGELKSGG